MCGACSDAVGRFIMLRRRNLSPEMLAKAAAYRANNT